LILSQGSRGGIYAVKAIQLPPRALRHLEALGMVHGSRLFLLEKKPSAMVISLRGTRYALGRSITDGIEVESL